jgi:hypothetical protein
MMTQEEAMNMSNEQAIQILIPMRNMMCDQHGCPISDAVFALDKAIEALSADRLQEWIPCSERLPRPYTGVLVCDECGWISLGLYRPCDVTEKDSGWSTLTRIKIPTDGIIAWMPLPEPWKGAEDD